MLLLFRTLADLECNLGIAPKTASIITYPRIYINAGVGCVFVRRIYKIRSNLIL